MPSKFLNGNQLKLMACVSMALDHIGVVLTASYLNTIPYGEPLFRKWEFFYLACRTVGRMAFPIFCFLLVEGFCHTRDWKKYGARLGIFALISEVPFDLAVSAGPFYPGMQNVFFTLLIGLLVMEGIRRSEEQMESPLDFGGLYKRLLVIGAGCLAAWALRTDYSFIGVLLIAILYLERQNPARACLLGAVWVFLCESAYLSFQIGAAAGFLPVFCYNGRRGRMRGKYGFYLFYPLHLLALYWISRWWFG